MCNYSERVHRGAKLLDEYKPTWYQDVDVDNLDMNMPWMLEGQGDVLSFVFSQEQDTLDEGGYYIGLDVLDLRHAPTDPWHYGFDMAPDVLDVPRKGAHWERGYPPQYVTEAYAALRDAWIREIEARYKAANLT
jgi:hypothetical protein